MGRQMSGDALDQISDGLRTGWVTAARTLEGRAALVLALAVLAVGVLLPASSEHEERVLRFMAYYSPAFIIGGVAGWLSLSKRVWFWVTYSLIVVLLFVHLAFFHFPRFAYDHLPGFKVVEDVVIERIFPWYAPCAIAVETYSNGWCRR